jgi:hypothetical protein
MMTLYGRTRCKKMIILKWILNKWGMKLGTSELVQDKIQCRSGQCYEPSGSSKAQILSTFKEDPTP